MTKGQRADGRGDDLPGTRKGGRATTVSLGNTFDKITLVRTVLAVLHEFAANAFIKLAHRFRIARKRGYVKLA